MEYRPAGQSEHPLLVLYLPAPQSVQPPEPAGACEPEGQLEQTVLPEPAAYVLEGQVVHCAEPEEEEMVPSPHDTHWMDPELVATWPAGQSVQALCPSLAWDLPAGQSVHWDDCEVE